MSMNFVFVWFSDNSLLCNQFSIFDISELIIICKESKDLEEQIKHVSSAKSLGVKIDEKLK